MFFRQALNDLAIFVESMTITHGFTGPWIAFGGSYPGSMVAWAREKYPHLINGGVSSSGPLLAKVNFYEFLEVVYKAFGRNGPNCNIAITTAIEELELMVDENKFECIQESFNLCQALDSSPEEDIAFLFYSIVEMLGQVVQYDHQGIGIERVCGIMEDESLGSPSQRMMTFFINDEIRSGAECLRLPTYKGFLDTYSQTDYSSAYRGWLRHGRLYRWTENSFPFF